MHIKEIDQLNYKPPTLLYTNIQTLAIVSKLSEYPADMVVAKILHLVLRIDSIKNLILNSPLYTPASKFIDCFQSQFPHLAGITISKNDH
ncbi:hypothetical protein COEREDRAFT_80840 [Coemansia reversa NRRL 1564]|uniref:Uncharacterized protein n=1 Tax=Coemansia reversa (strain ATCC 12441 / NRRL 1564) TaxID=763665 RepID=A0A2G5BDR9_COERN|nr:hypothetical protein COEREDRAFT_80840 [Coemansia reversa NRRL 1564]|eukprot:PIA17151.1 hypothetical protein COEREDRAFT_80840 [Coemansia reversa NRRL 1564]